VESSLEQQECAVVRASFAKIARHPDATRGDVLLVRLGPDRRWCRLVRPEPVAPGSGLTGSTGRCMIHLPDLPACGEVRIAQPMALFRDAGGPARHRDRLVEDSPSRTCQLIGDLKAMPPENGEVPAKTACLVYRAHLETDQQLLRESEEARDRAGRQRPARRQLQRLPFD
jgi:hypothetical protein